MSEAAGSPLTLAEAVPLGTVAVQRLLTSWGVRSLAYKGPAFAVLGVRRPRVSNDIDLLIHPDDRDRATAALTGAGWTRVWLSFPAAVDDIAYSTTVSHPRFPATVDSHHWVKGALAWPTAFDTMWEQRARVVVAHVEVCTPSAEHALVLEFLNAQKGVPPDQWGAKAQAVISGGTSLDVDVDAVAEAASSLGARETAAALIVGLGGAPLTRTPTLAFQDWLDARDRPADWAIFIRLLQRVPHELPRWLWRRITFGDDVARNWARVQGLPYKGVAHVLLLRLKRGRSR
ncbi:MAG: nucleotidyltransferase family protein [Nocardioidaceae bacterium]|nr:nucleotidyltransferase family protein [Nocardioidaceae bacterium]